MLYVLPLTALIFNLASAWAAPMCSLRSAASSAVSSAPPTPTPTTAPSSGNTTSPSGGDDGDLDIVATTWYAGWHTEFLPIQNVSWEKYTSVTYAFALTTPDSGTLSLNSDDLTNLPEFVSAAHSAGTKAMLTIGGWTGSQYFSTAVGSADNRTAFMNAALALVQQYNLDGLDFDWEYPGKQGVGCNIVNGQDTPNFLTFLQQLRAQAPNLTLSAATSIVPFADENGDPTTDVSGFAKVLDYIAIMNYDVWGTWSDAVGPNAPLNDTCAPAADQQGSAVSAVQKWTAAGFPAGQLVLGVAGYGHSFFVDQSAAFASSATSTSSAQPAGTTAIAAYPAFVNASNPAGDDWDVFAPASTDQCGNPVPAGYSGIWNFGGMIERGVLNADGTPASGMGYRFDDCSQTPYLYIAQNETMISYDDTESFAAKGKFIAEAGLRGFALWEAASDYQDMLIDSISNAIGIED